MTNSDEIKTGSAAPLRRPFMDRHLLTRCFRHVGKLTAGIVLLGLLWRVVKYAVGFPLWGDEAFVAVNFYTHSWSDMIRGLDYGQMAPLGWMWAELAMTRLLGYSEYVMRLLPWLCGLASLLLFWPLVRRIVDRRTAMLAVAVLACAFYPVRHASEIKPYAGDMLISLVLTALAWAVYLQPRSARRWALLTGATAVAIWVSFPAPLVAGGIGIFLTAMLWRRRQLAPWAGMAAFAAVSAASFLLMYVIYSRPQLQANPWYVTLKGWRGTFPPITQPWKLPLWLLDAHTGNMLAYPVGGNYGGSTFTFLMVVAGCVRMWRSGKKDLLLLLLAPLITTFVAAVFKKYPYGFSARTSLYMAPAFCLLAGAGMATCLKFLPRRLVPEGFRLAVIVMALIAIGGIIGNLVQPYKGPGDRDNLRALKDVAARTRPGDRWVIFNSLHPVPYAPHFYMVAGEGARFQFYVRKLAPVPVIWSPPPEEIAPIESGRTWLLAYRHHIPQCNRDNLLAAYVQQFSQRLGQGQGHHYEVTSPQKGCPNATIEVYEYPPR